MTKNCTKGHMCFLGKEEEEILSQLLKFQFKRTEKYFLILAYVLSANFGEKLNRILRFYSYAVHVEMYYIFEMK